MSTSEVEGVIHNIIKLNDATVYGVEVPGETLLLIVTDCECCGWSARTSDFVCGV